MGSIAAGLCPKVNNGRSIREIDEHFFLPASFDLAVNLHPAGTGKFCGIVLCSRAVKQFPTVIAITLCRHNPFQLLFLLCHPGRALGFSKRLARRYGLIENHVLVLYS